MQNRTGKHMSFSLYQDEAGRTIYYDRYTKKGYQISKKEEKKYFLFSSRPVSAFIVGYITYYFSHSWPISIFAAILAYLVILFFFRKLFLADLPEVPKFVPLKGDPLYVRSANMFSKGKIIVIIILAFLLSFGTAINAYISNYEQIVLILNYVLAVGAFIFGCFYIYVLIYKLKNK
ncbi:MAG: hypothetical protein Q4E33_05460 [Erysipelotrichaceae bacterium]|nr:hypothetical protein [Erysipelotrichaceae bacterium]